jgi:hypothetical protein
MREEDIPDELEMLYSLLAKPRRATTREAPPSERKAYLAAAARRYRARQRDAVEAGSPQPTNPAVRDALADAALMLLATDGPGAEQIRVYLARVFAGRPGVPATVTAKAKAGTLRPRFLKSR